MKHRNSPNLRSTLLALCLATAFPGAHAAEATTTSGTTTTTTSTTSTSTAIGTSSTTEARLSAEFADFLGGEEQASAVVAGLRQGTAFSLDSPSDSESTGGSTSTTTGSTTTTSTTSSATTTTTDTTAAIDPPTGTMGYGNVRITLRLAQAELSKLGITQPTTEELSAVLLGGEINGTQINGILTMRADGMGWGQIAKEYGMTVGQLMGKGAGLTKQTAATTTTTGSGKPAATASGKSPSGKTAQARANGYIPSGGKGHGTGVVTAGGGSLGAAAQGNGKGQSHKITTSAQGAGVVSAGGQHVSLAGGSSAGGKDMAPGQAKKN